MVAFLIIITITGTPEVMTGQRIKQFIGIEFLKSEGTNPYLWTVDWD